jgi:hypothetical protein
MLHGCAAFGQTIFGLFANDGYDILHLKRGPVVTVVTMVPK